MPSQRTPHAHPRRCSLVHRVGWILHDVSHAAAPAGANLHRRMGRFRRTPAHLAACLRRPARPGSHRSHGPPAARTRRLRSQPLRREQRLPGRRFHLPLFLCAGRRTQSQAGAQARPARGILAVSLRRLELIRRAGPISKQKMREDLGGSISLASLDHALGELWSRLRITRVDYNPAEGSSWDVLYRWSPDAVREGIGLSVGEALSALLSKYLDCVIAADQQEIEAFFGNFVPRSRVKEAVNALLIARELDFIRVGNRSLIQITPLKAV